MSVVAMMLCYFCGHPRDCTNDGLGWICGPCKRSRPPYREEAA